MKKCFFWQSFFSNHFHSFAIFKIPKILSEKSYQNLSDPIQFVYKKVFNLIKKDYFYWKKWEIQIITSKTMLTRSSSRMFNQMHVQVLSNITLTRYSKKIFNQMRCTGIYEQQYHTQLFGDSYVLYYAGSK